jgi:hypothetical protein
MIFTQMIRQTLGELPSIVLSFSHARTQARTHALALVFLRLTSALITKCKVTVVKKINMYRSQTELRGSGRCKLWRWKISVYFWLFWVLHCMSEIRRSILDTIFSSPLIHIVFCLHAAVSSLTSHVFTGRCWIQRSETFKLRKGKLEWKRMDLAVCFAELTTVFFDR